MIFFIIQIDNSIHVLRHFDFERHSNVVTILNGVTSHDDIYRVVGCIQVTESIVGVSYNWKITEYKHDGYCDMLLTLSTSKSPDRTDALE